MVGDIVFITLICDKWPSMLLVGRSCWRLRWSLAFFSNKVFLSILKWRCVLFKRGFPRSSVSKESAWVRKIPWRRKWQPTPVSLPGEFHGLRSLVGYSPWCRKSRTQLRTTPPLLFKNRMLLHTGHYGISITFTRSGRPPHLCDFFWYSHFIAVLWSWTHISEACLHIW